MRNFLFVLSAVALTACSSAEPAAESTTDSAAAAPITVTPDTTTVTTDSVKADSTAQ